MDSILEGLSIAVKDKIGKCTSAKALWDKLKNIYMVEEVIKESEESDEKNERNSSNKNESSEDEDIIQEDQEKEPPEKEVASNKLDEG